MSCTCGAGDFAAPEIHGSRCGDNLENRRLEAEADIEDETRKLQDENEALRILIRKALIVVGGATAATHNHALREKRSKLYHEMKEASEGQRGRQ